MGKVIFDKRGGNRKGIVGMGGEWRIGEGEEIVGGGEVNGEEMVRGGVFVNEMVE
ncbi:hypothetical protein [Bacillus altitudinis]|uniref:hypothetical protein n=1 Tax=Bacillus altitudinis TaxID=293387 RepID=UPI001643B872|nr:hypothetical protein [Bacillus altitudinis]